MSGDRIEMGAGLPAWVCGPNTLHIYRTNWPPGYAPQPVEMRSTVANSEAATRGREARLAKGDTGSIAGGLSKKASPGLHNADKARVWRVNRARARAVELCQPRYWNDAPCHAGHVGWRYTRNYACCECAGIAGRRAA